MKQVVAILLFLSGSFLNPVIAQFAPPAGQEGSTAIHMDSSIFIAWANSASVERGWLNIMDMDQGYVSAGSEENAIGHADFSVVSLGDLGKATLTFDKPIVDGPGFDFAVFENAFDDYFLELAFVEVSSDGEKFFTFPAISYTQTVEQVGSFGTLEAEKIHNLAGKYRSGYGVPFDLADLADHEGLDLNQIIQIRIVDAIGSISAQFASFDSEGNIVNDPFPTVFESGGFDLDAVGVIHNSENSGLWETYESLKIDVYPNPFQTSFWVKTKVDNAKVTISDQTGRVLVEKYISNERFLIDTENWATGLYIVRVTTEDQIGIQKVIKQ